MYSYVQRYCPFYSVFLINFSFYAVFGFDYVFAGRLAKLIMKVVGHVHVFLIQVQ